MTRHDDRQCLLPLAPTRMPSAPAGRTQQLDLLPEGTPVPSGRLMTPRTLLRRFGQVRR